MLETLMFYLICLFIEEVRWTSSLANKKLLADYTRLRLDSIGSTIHNRVTTEWMSGHVSVFVPS